MQCRFLGVYVKMTRLVLPQIFPTPLDILVILYAQCMSFQYHGKS